MIGEMKNMMNMADVITVTTDTLQKEMTTFGERVVVLRNKINLDYPAWNQPKVTRDRVTIGWAGGSSHFDDLQIVRQFVQQVCRSSNVDFMMCGYSKGGIQYLYVEDKQTGMVRVKEEKLERGMWDDVVDIFKQEIGDRFVVRNALPLEQYPKFFSEFDIAIAPLQDNRFNSGKSELKVVEAGVYSLPVVASDVAPYREIIKHGENGFLAKNTREWIKYLTRLINDKELRIIMGKNLRATVEKRYNANDQKKLVDLYRKLKGG